MSRQELHHRIQLLDGVARAIDLGVNDEPKTLIELDLTGEEGMATLLAIAQGQDPEGKGRQVSSGQAEVAALFLGIFSNAEMRLQSGFDLTVSGWFNFPDQAEPPIEPAPDPSGGIEVQVGDAALLRA
jgi:hypothetical protein